MRIISQNGRIDFPYENFSLSITKDNCIVATRDTVASISEISISVIAKYSTEEKARKALEMLRRSYVGTIYAQNTEVPEGGAEELKEMVKHGFGILSVVKDSDIVKFEPLNICFQFPADDELED